VLIRIVLICAFASEFAAMRPTAHLVKERKTYGSRQFI
jgi:hypothetical protein